MIFGRVRGAAWLCLIGVVAGCGSSSAPPTIDEERLADAVADKVMQRIDAQRAAAARAESSSARPSDPATSAGASDAPEPDPEPETVAARHILVQYVGAARQGSSITRTEKEARKLAAQIADEARRPGADFEALARQHSDGPTSTRGGDLGEFSRGRMHPDFEDAAFALPVGGVSDVVETPFGFHVIQRYR